MDDIISKIEALVADNKQKRRQNKASAYQLAQALHESSRPLIKTIEEEGDFANQQLLISCDALARELLQCAIDYFKAKYKDEPNARDKSLEIIRYAAHMPSTTTTKHRIDDNVQGIEDWTFNNTPDDDEQSIYNFDKIRLQTAFSFMTCDGDIDQNEVALIKSLANDQHLFGDIDIDIELDFLVEIINQKGKGYLKDYFKVLKNAKIKKEQEIQLVQIAVNILNADGVLDYNETKFFRIFRTLLQVSNQEMAAGVPNIPEDFLEEDIFTNSYMEVLFDDYFDNIEIPVFDRLELHKDADYISPDSYKKDN